MSQSDLKNTKQAVALHYGSNNNAPVVVASGMGYLAEKIVEVASDNGVPIYEENSLATMLSQLQLGQEIPPALYQAIVDIYIYFLGFNTSAPENSVKPTEESAVAPSHSSLNRERKEDIEHDGI